MKAMTLACRRSAPLLTAAALLALIATAAADAHIGTGYDKPSQSIVRGTTVFNPTVDPKQLGPQLPRP
jgi:hypothetical protein